jgi:hypothetical protein
MAEVAAADADGATLWAANAAGLGYLGGETFERRPLYAFLFGLGVALLVALVVRRRGGFASAALAVGAQSDGGQGDEHGRRPRRSVVVRYYAVATESGLVGDGLKTFLNRPRFLVAGS